MNNRFRTFSSLLSSYLTIACAALYATALVILSLFAGKLAKQEAIKSVQNSLQAAQADIESILNDVKTPVGNMAWVVQEHLDDPEYMFSITQHLVTSNQYIIGSAVAFEPGYYESKGKYYAPYSHNVEGSDSLSSFQMGDEDYDYFSMEWYMFPVLSGDGYWSEPYFDEGGGNLMMTTYSLPIRDSGGNIVAVLTSDISLSDLTDRIESVKSIENAYNVLISQSGALLSYPDKSKLLVETIFKISRDNGLSELATIAEGMVAGHSGAEEFSSDEGRKSFVVYGPLLNGWSAAIICRYRDIFASSNNIGVVMLVAMTLGLLLLYLFIRKFIWRQTEPITEFSYSALAIAKGNFHARVPESGTTDEFEHLRRSFTYMEKSINRYISELKTSNLENERYENELNIAKDIQMNMVHSSFPSHEAFDMFATLHPAKEVGGDLYDYVVRDGKLYFVIGDVSGKGVPAALYMAILKYAFSYIAKTKDNARDILAAINDSFSERNDSALFATIFVGIIDFETLEMDYCNGGHNPIVVVSPQGEASYLKARPNLATGLFEDFPYVGESLRLSKGTRLVLYTDGVTEAEDSVKNQYGEDRLLEMCSSADAGLSAKDFVESLVESVHSFTGGNAQNDDITVMSILVK